LKRGLPLYFAIALFFSGSVSRGGADPDPYPINGLSVEEAIELCIPAAYSAAAESGLSLNPEWPAEGGRTEGRQIAISLVLATHHAECPPQTRFICRVGAHRLPEIVAVYHDIEERSCPDWAR
jgi:hypothetical protein